VSTFNHGSPVSSPTNPYNMQGAGQESADILPDLDITGAEMTAMSNLDAYGSSPVTDDSASGRPSNPPTSAQGSNG
jgi:hypothetical protein